MAMAMAVAAQETKPAARKPQIWAIVVGIDNYIDPLIADSRVALHDAGEVRGWFLGPGGWKRDHLLFLRTSGASSPARSIRLGRTSCPFRTTSTGRFRSGSRRTPSRGIWSSSTMPAGWGRSSRPRVISRSRGWSITCCPGTPTPATWRSPGGRWTGPSISSCATRRGNVRSSAGSRPHWGADRRVSSPPPRRKPVQEVWFRTAATGSFIWDAGPE